MRVDDIIKQTGGSRWGRERGVQVSLSLSLFSRSYLSSSARVAWQVRDCIVLSPIKNTTTHSECGSQGRGRGHGLSFLSSNTVEDAPAVPQGTAPSDFV